MTKKKCLIVSIYDNLNYGNRLQNYALQKVLENFDLDVVNVDNRGYIPRKHALIEAVPTFFLQMVVSFGRKLFCNNRRVIENINVIAKYLNFYKFTKSYTKVYSAKKVKRMTFDYAVAGSDQIWNFTFKKNNMDYNLLNFVDCPVKFSYAASIGMKNLDDEQKHIFKKGLENFNAISVRESSAKDLLQPLTDKDIRVLLDPTFLLGADEWGQLCEQPADFPYKRFILVYFLGERNEEFNRAISAFRTEKDCECVDIYDKTDKLFSVGPTNFLWLIRNAEYVITDSFHATVFSVIFKKKVAVLSDYGERADMSSRFDTLKELLDLDLSVGGIDENKMNGLDYDKVFMNIEKERARSLEFLQNLLEEKAKC